MSTTDTLARAIAFIEGFEDDPLQEGIPELLADLNTVSALVNERSIDALTTYAREATIAITNLTVGGSEFFGKRIGDIYLADLPYCVAHIREQLSKGMEARFAASGPRVKELESEIATMLTVLQMTVQPLEWCQKQWADSPQSGEGINVLAMVNAVIRKAEGRANG